MITNILTLERETSTLSFYEQANEFLGNKLPNLSQYLVKTLFRSLFF